MGMWRIKNICTLLVGIQTGEATLENGMERFLKKLEIEIPYDSVIALLENPKYKTLIHENTCTPIFIAVFTIAKLWKQPMHVSTDEWIKKSHTHTHTHTHEYYSAIEKNEILPSATT